jgi:hypothetical protein
MMNFNLTMRSSSGLSVAFKCGCRCSETPSRDNSRVAGSMRWTWCSPEHEGWTVRENGDGSCDVTELGLCANRDAA